MKSKMPGCDEVKSYVSQKIETMSRKELSELQFRKLLWFLHRAYKNNPYWRERFDESKISLEKIKSLDHFREFVPFSDKNTLLEDQLRNPMFGSRLGVPAEDVTQFHLSSGTSGQIQEVHSYTARDVELSGAVLLYHFIWAGLRRGDAIAITFPFALTGFPLAAFSAIQKIGGKPFMIGSLDNKNRLETMHRFSIDYLFATPIYLTRLLDVCEEMGERPGEYLHNLTTIGLSAGSYPLYWAQKMEALWNTKLSEFYACSGAGGVVSATCERGVFDGPSRTGRGAMHLLENHYLIEILDSDSMMPVEPGEEGELVVTNLDKIAEPVIRYRTRDRARYLGVHCPCGRPMASIECGTIGRLDDMIKIKGVNIWPAAFDEIIFSWPEIGEYNGRVSVDQTGKEKVVVLIEYKTAQELSRKEGIAAGIKEEVKRRIGIQVEVVESADHEIEKFDLKAKRWRDQREDSLDRIVTNPKT